MARRKDESFVNVMYEIFMGVPSWVCVPVAFFAYFVIQIAAAVLAQNKTFSFFASLGPLFGYAVGGLILLAGFKAAIDKRIRRNLLEKQTGIDSIRQLSWSSFELLVGEAYRRQGYQVIETGGGGPDGGIDLKLLRNGTTTIVQCKQWRIYKVGVKPIRELYGVMMAQRADHAIFVTSGVYTAEAKEFAIGKPMTLIDGETLARLIQPVRDQLSQTPETTAESKPIELHVSTSATAPSCPRCESPMVLRTAKRGSHAGSEFWGCSAYPKCKAVQNVT